MTLRRATERDHDVIIDLIDVAAEWLRTKNTDHYPSAALFQKPTDRIEPLRQAFFRLVPTLRD